jgi:hypothetical protein
MDYINQIRGAAMPGCDVEQEEKCYGVAVLTVGESIKERIKYHNDEARRLQVQYDAINGTAVLNMRMNELEKLLHY